MVGGKKTMGKSKYAKKSRPVTRNEVKRMLDANIEDKFTTNTLTSTWSSVAGAWVELNLCNPGEGDTGYTRTGRKIRIKSLEIKGVAVQGSSESLTDDAYNVMRVVIGWYTGTTDTPLQTAGIGINGSFNNLNKGSAQLVRKYLDRYITLPVTSTEQGAGDGYAPGMKHFRYYKKFKQPLTIQYGDDTATYPSHRLIMSVISDSVAVPNPGLNYGYFIVRFEDA